MFDETALNWHMTLHQQCPFCGDMAYDVEDMFTHVRELHWVCHLCPISAATWVGSAEEMIDHMRYAWPIPKCT